MEGSLGHLILGRTDLALLCGVSGKQVHWRLGVAGGGRGGDAVSPPPKRKWRPAWSASCGQCLLEICTRRLKGTYVSTQDSPVDFLSSVESPSHCLTSRAPCRLLTNGGVCCFSFPADILESILHMAFIKRVLLSCNSYRTNLHSRIALGREVEYLNISFFLSVIIM